MKNYFILKLFLILVLNPLKSNAQLGKTQLVRIDSLLTKLESDDIFSGSVLISHKNAITFSRQVGYSNKQSKIKNTLNTRFYIGSITKLYTKILVYQLVQDGKISLKDKVAKYLTGFNKNVANTVTIEHLISHSSGLGQYYDHPEFESRKKNITSINDLLYFIKSEELLFKPGTEFEYSNSGYVVLGAIIEKVTNMSYQEALSKYIFQKINADNSTYSIVNKPMDSVAQGYLTNQLTGATNTELFLTGASDGGVITSAYELFKFDSILFSTDILLNEKSKLQVFTQRGSSQPISRSQDAKFAIAGGDPGLSAIYARNIIKDYTIIVLSNYDDPVTNEVLRSLVDIMNNKAASPVIGSIAQHLKKYINENGCTNFKSYVDSNITKSLSALSENDMPLLYLANYLTESERLFDALCVYEIYTKYFPKIIIAWEELAAIYLKLNKSNEALSVYLRLHERFPDKEKYNQQITKLKK